MTASPTARPLNLLRYFTSASIAIVLALSLGTIVVGRSVVDGALLALERDEADSVAEDVVTLLRARGIELGGEQAPRLSSELDADVRRVLANFGVERLVVFGHSNSVVLEIDREPTPPVSEVVSWAEGAATAWSGRVASRWLTRPGLFGGARSAQIETFSPVREARDGKGAVRAIALVRRDFTPALADARVWLGRLSIVALGFGGAVFLSLWLLVRKADRVLREQRMALDASDRELRARNAELAELGRRKDEFYAICSHDLRSPLLSTHAGCRFLLERGGSCEAQRQVLHQNLRAVQDALRLIDNVLDLARIESGVDRFQPEPLEITEVVAETVEGQSLVAAARGVDLRFSAPEVRCVIEADRMKVRRILDNLVGNALRHAPGAPVAVRVAVGDADVRIAVQDGGAGIAPERLAVIFERFNHGADGSRREGTGLGLSIARDFAAQHGGRIEVESRTGHGSTFTVVLPRAAPAH